MPMISRKLFAVLALGLVCWVGTAQAEDKLPVRIGVLRSSLFTSLHGVALQGGYYDKAGLDAKVTDFRSGDGSAGLESVLRGSLDVYIGTPNEVARVDSEALEAGEKAPLAIVAAGVKAITTLVMRKDVPYTKIQDLTGLKIGVSSLGSGHLVVFRYFLNEQGLTTDSLKLRLVPVGGPDMPAALLTNQIDGFLHSEPTPSLAIVKAGAWIAIPPKGLGEAGNAPNMAVIMGKEWSKAHAETARRVVRALEQASADYPSMSKAQVMKIFQEYERADDEVMSLAYDHSDPRLGDLKEMAAGLFKVNIAAMQTRGEVSTKLKPEDLFDYSFAKP